MLNRRLLRTVAAVLLVWIAADLAALDTCVLDCEKQPAAAQATVAAAEHHGGAAHPLGLNHPDYCFCHGLSTGAAHALLTAPRRQAETVLESPPGHPLHASAALYHPPQLPA